MNWNRTIKITKYTLEIYKYHLQNTFLVKNKLQIARKCNCALRGMLQIITEVWHYESSLFFRNIFELEIVIFVSWSMIGSLGPDGSSLALKDLFGWFTTDYYQIRLIRLPILIYHKKHPFEHSRSLHVNLRSRSASCPSPARLSMTWEYWTCHLDYSACYRGRITMRHGARHSAGENF